ncbi:hypothetical protein HPP92_005005 [Vanilla planifolia]|uniref:Uncharacterized protein n=1 Tax=Vanilla planifolia TaxID=51239 RepID=A0A835RSL6_VANPL|nr:hypothetical protein HPP92_005005 [Vanilla planifolia]
MVNAYNTTYYTSLQDTITNLCKSILPFTSKIRRLTAADKLAKRHSDNLKWQQDSFHSILKLICLYKENIVPEAEVSSFRSHLLETLIVSPAEPDPPTVNRDKLLFLQELFYAKCISLEEYHSSKRPLLQRLAAQGVEINSRDVIVGTPLMNQSEEEWTDIDLNDQEPQKVVEKGKVKTPLKFFWIGKANKEGSNPKEKDGNKENSRRLMPQTSSLFPATNPERAKRKPFSSLLQKAQQDQQDENWNPAQDDDAREEKSLKKQWGFERFKKWKRSSCEDESTKLYLPQGERSDTVIMKHCSLEGSLIGEEADTKKTQKMIHSNEFSSNFYINQGASSNPFLEDSGENIKKELVRIQSELSATHQKFDFSSDQMEAISIKLPADKNDLNKFFPKPWCIAHGDGVLDAVKKEFEDHFGQMEALRTCKHGFEGNWVVFDNDNQKNFQQELFSNVQFSSNELVKAPEAVGDRNENNNPFAEVHNPFWTPNWCN